MRPKASPAAQRNMAFGDVWWVQNSQLLKTQVEKTLLPMFTHNDEFNEMDPAA